MADNNNIKEFTAADIEKYWSGKLSTAEMHAMEKAAMDDPFLADALEGYANATTPDRDINYLKEKIEERVLAAPVVSIKKKRVIWWRVAAAVIIIAGAGVLLQQYVVDKQNAPSIAKTQKEELNNPDEIVVNKGSSDTIKEQIQQAPQTIPGASNLQTQQKGLEVSPSDLSASAGKQDPALIVTDTARENKKDLLESPVAAETVKAPAADREMREVIVPRAFDDKARTDTTNIKGYYNLGNQNNAVSAKGRSREFLNTEADQGITLGNSFKYKVVDAQNNPVPFANVFNTRDNVGTYTDLKGNFHLLSSDTIMDVQIRSLGFNSSNYRLLSSNQGNLVLKEDEETRRQITAQNRKMVSSLIRKDSAELEEPEAGWGNYNTYVANNIQIPENIRGKNLSRSDVELSFEVDRNGQPTNIKITKSSHCKACDDEAIRLLREGPKWKKKGKKNKTTISIAVNQ